MKTPYGLSHVGIDSEPDGLIDAASVQRNRSLPVSRPRLMSCRAVRAWSACHLCCPDPLSIIASLTTHPVVAEPRPPTRTPSGDCASAFRGQRVQCHWSVGLVIPIPSLPSPRRGSVLST